jgi:hypothetical protein
MQRHEISRHDDAIRFGEANDRKRIRNKYRSQNLDDHVLVMPSDHVVEALGGSVIHGWHVQ